jgi:hypothetical protein
MWARLGLSSFAENRGFFLAYDRHVVDISHVSSEAQALALLQAELQAAEADTDVILLAGVK